MNQSKTILTFRKIPAEDLKALDRFVHSPYFNTHQGVVKVFETLLPYYPKFDSKKLQREKLFPKIFPNEKYDYQKISDYMSYFTKLLEQFIYQQSIEKDRLLKNTFQLKAFRQYGLDKAFEKSLGILKSNTHKNEALSQKQHFYAYQLEEESDLYFTALDSRSLDKSIERKTAFLDKFYISEKLKSTCEMLNRQNIIQDNYQIDFLDELLSYLNENLEKYAESPDIAIYYRILMGIKFDKETTHYPELIRLLKENHTEISRDELRSMYDFAQNYCIKKINQGDEKYLSEIFELYKTLLEEALLFENELLSEWDYKNIVTVATRLKSYRWAEDFIEKYKNRLAAKTRENAYYYNLAALYYSEANYTKAMQLLQNVEFTDVYYNLGGRCLLLKSYFESEEIDPLFSLAEAFKIYLRRSKLISAYQYTAHMNLVKFTKQLAKIKNMRYSSKKETIQKQMTKLKAKMQSQSEISNAKWLQQQITAMEQDF